MKYLMGIIVIAICQVTFAAPPIIEPFNVNVINDSTAPIPVNVQASPKVEVLITTQTYTGDLGGPWGATAKCQVEFEGSHFCSYDRDGVRYVAVPADFGTALAAWIDPSGRIGEFVIFVDQHGINADNIERHTCFDWTSSIDEDLSSHLGLDGRLHTHSLDCSDSFPIACCR